MLVGQSSALSRWAEEPHGGELMLDDGKELCCLVFNFVRCDGVVVIFKNSYLFMSPGIIRDKICLDSGAKYFSKKEKKEIKQIWQNVSHFKI